MEHIIATLLRDFEEGKMTRRQLIQTLAFTTAAASGTAALVEAGVAADTPAARAVSINHVSYQVADCSAERRTIACTFRTRTVLTCRWAGRGSKEAEVCLVALRVCPQGLIYDSPWVGS